MRSKGEKRGTRKLLKKSVRGMPSTSKITEVYNVGDTVDIVLDSSVHKGMPNYRFHGMTGIICDVNKRAVKVYVQKKAGHKKILRYLNIRIEHLRKSRSTEAADKIREAIANNTYVRRVIEGPREAVKIPKANNKPIELNYKQVFTRY